MRRAEDPPGERRIVVVLGMHRSGTSALTRGLQVLGIDLGEHLIGAIPGNNEKGFWEDADINAFDDALLRELGSGWDRLNVLDEAALRSPALAERRAEATQLLLSKLTSAAIFAFKDPRAALLLPFWQEVFAGLGLRPSYVVAVRNPAEVAQSLARRDGMNLAKGMLLWMKYSVAAVRNTEGLPRVFVAYGNLMEDPEKQLERIAIGLSLPTPQKSPGALLQYTDEFLSPELRHNVLPSGALVDPALIPPMVTQLYDLLEDLAADRIKHDDYARGWKGLEEQYANAAPLLNGMDAAEHVPTRSSTVASTNQAAAPLPGPLPTHVPLRFFRQLDGLQPQFHKMVHRWNVETLVDGGKAWHCSDKRLLVSGWVWPTATGHRIRLATRQSGVTRSYPLNVQRPDVVDVMRSEIAAGPASSYCGFRYAVDVEVEFEIGFEVDGWLFWLYRAESTSIHDAAHVG